MKSEDISANRFIFDPKSTADVRAKLKQDPQAGLKQAAQQFEGMLLQMMLKSMRDATPQEGLLDNDQTRFFTSIMDQQLAQNLSAQGKLGFAKLIEQHLGRTLPGKSSETLDVSLENLQKAYLELQSANSAAGANSGGGKKISAQEVAAGAAVTGVSTGPTGSNDFVNKIWPYAVDSSRTLGIPPQFLVAHAALETGWGKREIRSPDGTATYNLFGVKAGKSWQGRSVEVATTEYVNGVAQNSYEKFRVYGSYAESFRDYVGLLRSNPRFSGVLGQQDGTQFARTLQQSGYATDPLYADKLSRIINGNTLRQALMG